MHLEGSAPLHMLSCLEFPSLAPIVPEFSASPHSSKVMQTKLDYLLESALAPDTFSF